MRLPPFLVGCACACAIFVSAVSAHASEWLDWRWRTPLQPCAGDCAFMVFAGKSVSSNVESIYFKAIPPWRWMYENSTFVGATASRRVATIFSIIDIEAELGAGKRFGNQKEGEFWGAMYVRYTAFPWNNYLMTTFAASTGISYATGISEFENEHSQRTPPEGTRIQHYFSPEVTFALPEYKDRQVVIRLHHRSGAYGVVSPAMSGATYLAVGFRAWF